MGLLALAPLFLVDVVARTLVAARVSRARTAT